jgi:integration host factor subunit alpha
MFSKKFSANSERFGNHNKHTISMRRQSVTINKAHLVERISVNCGYSKKRSSELLESLMETIKATLESGENVLISGFGKFNVKYKAARKGRNPQTGRVLILEERRNLTFGCSEKLRDKLNGNHQRSGKTKRQKRIFIRGRRDESIPYNL